MSNYRKLVAGIVGISMILLKHFAGIELPGLADHLIEVAMAIGTWVSVWWFKNEPPSRNSDRAQPISDVSPTSGVPDVGPSENREVGNSRLSEIGSLNAEVGNSRLPGAGE